MKSILLNPNEVHYVGENADVIPMSAFTEIELGQINSFIKMIEDKAKSRRPMIPIPEGTSVYTMIKPCHVRGDLDVKIYNLNYSNDKDKKVIKIDIVAIHFDANGERVPIYDGYSYVIADMSEERKVEVSEGVYEYSYTLANTFLENAMPINQLIATAIQIADADGSLNKRLYNL